MGLRTVTLLALLACLPSPAQSPAATLRGQISDATGAAVPDADLELMHADQNRRWRAKSNSLGEYSFVQIPPGRYALSVEAPGFKRLIRNGLTLEVAQVALLNLTLELGSLNETVEVTAEVPLLEAASSSLGEVVNSRTAEALPLNGRNALQLVALTPGINTNRSFRSAMTPNGNIAAVAFTANGGRNLTNEVLLDGSPQIVMGYNQAAFVPNPDALQEFRVQTNSLSAEYGRTGGAVVNLVHRSGGSEFHGTLFEFLRNDKFDANNFFDNRNGRSKAPFRYNQFGFTTGGPLTPGRKSTFFFVSYEGIRQVNPSTTTLTVPTTKMRQGDFSETATIHDPATINAAGARAPFPQNQIPPGRFNAVAVKLLSFYPEPNLPGVVNNYFTQSGTRDTGNNISIKIDRRVSPRQNAFGRFSYNRLHRLFPDLFHNDGSPNLGDAYSKSVSATLDDVWMAHGWLLHGNYGYVYFANPRDARSHNFDQTSLGLPAELNAVAQFRVFPRIQPAGYAPLGGEAQWIVGNKFETHTWAGDATRLVGRHSVKIGGTYRLNRVSTFRPVAPAGIYTFNEGWTRAVFNGSQGGHSIASLLLGYMAAGQIQQEPALAIQVPYAGVFVQTDWRVHERLTLNLGLRWEGDRPMTERFDRTSWFDPDATLPVTVSGLGPLRGGLRFAGSRGQPGPNPRGNKDPDNNNFAPRVGFAYRLRSHLVLRGGFGVFYSPTTGFGPNTGNTGAVGFNAVTAVVTSTDGGRTPATTLSNPFPNGFAQPTNGSQGLMTLFGETVNGLFRFDRTPYSMQWNFNIQYELKGGMLFDAAYAGNAGVKLLAQAEWNQLPDLYLALGDELTRPVRNPFFGLAPRTAALGQTTITAGQLLRPFPQLSGLQQTWGSLAHSSYHALQMKFRKRYRAGLQTLVAYTWSKLLDDFSSTAGFLGEPNPGYTNNNNRRLDKSLSALDIAHRLVVNYQYELPFGSGRRWLNRGGFVGAVAGGWSLSGITTVQSGPPITILSAANTTGSFGGVQRPNSTGLSTRSPGGIKERLENYFNTAAFVNPPRYRFGNVGRFLPDNRAPYLHWWDLSVSKAIHITESKRMELRGDFFNLMNHANFAAPSGVVFGRPGFGAITESEPARIVQLGLKLRY